MTTQSSGIRLVLADSLPLSRIALEKELHRTPGLQVVAAVANSGDAETSCREQRPDVALLDLVLAGSGGIATTAAVKAQTSDVRVVVVSPWPDQKLLAAAVEAGADGFVTKTMSLAELVEAVRRTHAGEAVIPPMMLGSLLRDLLQRNAEAERATALFARLTPREKEVLALLVEGRDHAGVADRLVISPETAKTHIQNVITKLGVHSRLAAAALAVEYGLVPRHVAGEITLPGRPEG